MSGGGADPFTPLLTQGILGIVVILLLVIGRYAYLRLEAGHRQELETLKESHARELTNLKEAHGRELAAKDTVIAALGVDKAALTEGLAEQTRFFRDSVVPGMTRFTDTARDVLSDLTHRAVRG